MIGPFTMQTTGLAAAFNAFYRQHQFPKPDPNSEENSMAGLDPSSAGLGQGDIIFCQLSPLHRITLDDETKDAANIPRQAEFFAWAYPAVDDGSGKMQGTRPESVFLQYGGYVYFNGGRDAIATNAIVPAPFETLGLMFGRAQPLSQMAAETLTRQGRFQEITLDSLRRKGATHFAWIRPGEFADAVASENGCFAYRLSSAEPIYFPVVTKPVFTKELLDEDLEDNEAWVVVRTRAPMVETPTVFDKQRSFEENLQDGPLSNAFGASNGDIKVAGPPTTPPMSYEQWQQTPGKGTIAEPWIMQVGSSGNS